jgi:hypothetical protein
VPKHRQAVPDLVTGRWFLFEWPPTTGTMRSGVKPVASAAKADSRTTSRVVTPNSRMGLKFPADLSTSVTSGTREFTGFEIIRINASGPLRGISFATSRTMTALSSNKSTVRILCPGTADGHGSFRAAKEKYLQ